MKTAICIRDMTISRQRHFRAFTIMELLVVIGIIAVVAGLVVGLGAIASEKKKISRALTERDRLVTFIHSYKAKMGTYPPDHQSNPGVNTLLYELAGAIRDTNNTVSDPNYLSPFGNVQSNILGASFAARGILNAVDILGETNDVNRFMKELRPDQMAQVVSGSLSLVVPIDGANGQQPNPWKYLAGENAVHNKDSFDLWVEIKSRGQTRMIGNWKD